MMKRSRFAETGTRAARKPSQRAPAPPLRNPIGAVMHLCGCQPSARSRYDDLPPLMKLNRTRRTRAAISGVTHPDVGAEPPLESIAMDLPERVETAPPYEFSPKSMHEHWAVGLEDTARSLRRPEFFRLPEGTAIKKVS